MLSWSRGYFTTACDRIVLYCMVLQRIAVLQPRSFLLHEVYEDNLACIAMSENAVRRKYSRHIDIRRYSVRELVADGAPKLVPLRTH